MLKIANQKIIQALYTLTFYFMALHSVYAEVGSGWDSFIKHPNQNTYVECSKEIDLSLSGEYERFQSPSYRNLIKNFNLGKILKLVESGNTYAVKLTLQFYPLFWNNLEVNEEITISLGKLIKKNPKFFLQIVKEYFAVSIKSFDRLTYILAMYGDEFVDDFEKRIKETDDRIAALQQVREQDLIELRDKCIGFLTKEKEFIKKAAIELSAPNK